MQQWIDALMNSNYSEERVNAIKNLGEAQHIEAAPHIAEVLVEDFDAGVRYQAALVLAKFADPGTTDQLLDALRDEDLWVRVSVTDALIRIGQPSVEGLVLALRDENHAVRRAAAKALGKIGDAAAVRGLRGAIIDADTDVRRFAAEALGRIGDVETIDILGDALRDDQEKVRHAAAAALVKFGEQSVPVLLNVLDDPNPSVTITAVFALKEIGYRPPAE